MRSAVYECIRGQDCYLHSAYGVLQQGGIGVPGGFAPASQDLHHRIAHGLLLPTSSCRVANSAIRRCQVSGVCGLTNNMVTPRCASLIAASIRLMQSSVCCVVSPSWHSALNAASTWFGPIWTVNTPLARSTSRSAA